MEDKHNGEGQRRRALHKSDVPGSSEENPGRRREAQRGRWEIKARRGAQDKEGRTKETCQDC